LLRGGNNFEFGAHWTDKMVKRKSALITQIAATYIGTVVGSGFATGQEILQFFTVYYVWGIAGIIVSTILFIWLGSKMMLLSEQMNAHSYQELNTSLFGPYLGKIVNLFVFIVLFGTTSVMVSGTGAIFEEQLELPYQLGIIVTIVLSFFVILKGLRGILVVNSFVVPLMLMFSLIVFVKFTLFNPFHSLTELLTPLQTEHNNGKWFLSSLTYVAFNLTMAQAVLVPLGKEIKDRSILKWGGVWGGIGLGFMLLTTHLALQSLMPGVVGLDVPMANVIRELGWVVLLLFLIVVYGEVFTTLIGNVFGITRQIQSMFSFPEKLTILMILLTSFVISQIGFSTLVTYLYPAFGYFGLVLLLVIAVRK
jgi:uncharacterized membrane protein YkvI